MKLPTVPLCCVLLGLLGNRSIAQVNAAHGPSVARHRQVDWSVDLKAALAEAKASQRLVLVAFNMDGEQANERALEMYRSADFAAATANVVCVLCSKDEHSGEDAACSRFASCTCAEHIASERQARRHFFGASEENLAPQHILLFPDGVVAWHAIYEVAPADILKAIEGAHSMKTLPLAQRLRSQRGLIGQLRGRADKNVATAYMQIQACLAQTPAEHFVDALSALSKGLAERVLRDLEGHPREQALPLLRAGGKHSTKATRELALALAASVEKREEPAVEAPPSKERVAGPSPLTAPLKVLGPADDFTRVHWAGPEQTLDSCRDQVTVIWFFLAGAADKAEQVAIMNAFAAAHAASGVRTLGLVADLRPSDAGDRLASLGCNFPVGAFQATSANKLFGVETFPTWIVLDPDTSVVHRSRQDGKGFDWAQARELAARMAISSAYANRLTKASPSR